MYPCPSYNLKTDEFRAYSQNWLKWDDIQGDPKLAPPLPGQDKKCSMKTKDSIFKYILFKYYLESSGVLDQIQKLFSRKMQKKAIFSQFWSENVLKTV